MASLPHIEIDPNASPADSMDTNTTPDTEYSPPESPFNEHHNFIRSKRMAARKKLEKLTQEEKVRQPFANGPDGCKVC
jgi:beta-glucosidase